MVEQAVNMDEFFEDYITNGSQDGPLIAEHLRSLMESWSSKQISDYVLYTKEGAYITRMPLESEQTRSDDIQLVREGNVAKCIVFLRHQKGVHVLMKPPGMAPNKRMLTKNRISPRQRLVEYVTKARNQWKLPGGRTNLNDRTSNAFGEEISDFEVHLITALREMTEEFGHIAQVTLFHSNQYFTYSENGGTQLQSAPLSSTVPVLILHGQRTHGPEEWEREGQRKYPGVLRCSQVMFIIGELHDPFNTIPVESPVHEENNSAKDPYRWWPYSAMVHNDFIARGLLPNLDISDFIDTEYEVSHFPFPLHRRTLLDTEHWVSDSGTVLRMFPGEDAPAMVTTSDQALNLKQRKLAKLDEPLPEGKGLPVRKEHDLYQQLMQSPANHEKSLIDHTKKRHEGGAKASMFGFRYRIPKRASMLSEHFGLTALVMRDALREGDLQIDETSVMQACFETEYGNPAKPWLPLETIEGKLKQWLGSLPNKQDASKRVSKTNMLEFLNLWLTSLQVLSEYECDECSASQGIACAKPEPVRGDLQDLPRFTSRGGVKSGKVLNNQSSFFTQGRGVRKRRDDFIRDCFIPLLRMALHASESRTLFTSGPLSDLAPHPKGLQVESDETVNQVVNSLAPILSSHISKKGSGEGIPFVHLGRYRQLFTDIKPFFALSRSNVSEAASRSANTDSPKTISSSLTQQCRIFSVQRRLGLRKKNQQYDRLSYVDSEVSRTSRILWEWITTMEHEAFRTVAIDAYEQVHSVHQIPILEMISVPVQVTTSNRFAEVKQTPRANILPERFVTTQEHWGWGETCPHNEDGLKEWFAEASTSVGWGKLPIVSPNATLGEAMGVAAMAGGYVAVGIDAYVWPGTQGPRSQLISNADRSWNISESLFEQDNMQLKTELPRDCYDGQQDVTITRTLSQSINGNAPLFIQRRVLGVLKLPILRNE